MGRAEDMAYRSVSGMRTMREDIGPRLLAAEQAVGLHDVVVDLEARRRRKGAGEATSSSNADNDDDTVNNDRDGDDEPQEREPEPAGQTGSS